MSTVATTEKFLGDEARKLITRQLSAKNASPDEIEAYLQVVERTRLDHFAGQIMASSRRNNQEQRDVLSYLVRIDGFRLIAERTGKYAGQIGPFWCGDDCAWKEVWLGNVPPSAAKIGILRRDFSEPLWATARWDAYAQVSRDGKLMGLWGKMGDLMLAKVAEALGLRRAFPQDLSGLYTTDEMDQASNAPATSHRSESLKEQPCEKPNHQTASRASAPPAVPSTSGTSSPASRAATAAPAASASKTSAPATSTTSSNSKPQPSTAATAATKPAASAAPATTATADAPTYTREELEAQHHLLVPLIGEKVAIAIWRSAKNGQERMARIKQAIADCQSIDSALGVTHGSKLIGDMKERFGGSKMSPEQAIPFLVELGVAALGEVPQDDAPPA